MRRRVHVVPVARALPSPEWTPTGPASGTVTVQETIRPGTTGVWVMIERPNGHSQNPAEFYTSELAFEFGRRLVAGEAVG